MRTSSLLIFFSCILSVNGPIKDTGSSALFLETGGAMKVGNTRALIGSVRTGSVRARACRIGRLDTALKLRRLGGEALRFLTVRFGGLLVRPRRALIFRVFVGLFLRKLFMLGFLRGVRGRIGLLRRITKFPLYFTFSQRKVQVIECTCIGTKWGYYRNEVGSWQFAGTCPGGHRTSMQSSYYRRN